MHVFSENSPVPLQHDMVTNQGGLWLPKVTVGEQVRVISLCPNSDLLFVLVRLECVAVTTAELIVWYKRASRVK